MLLTSFRRKFTGKLLRFNVKKFCLLSIKLARLLTLLKRVFTGKLTLFVVEKFCLLTIKPAMLLAMMSKGFRDYPEENLSIDC